LVIKSWIRIWIHLKCWVRIWNQWIRIHYTAFEGVETLPRLGDGDLSELLVLSQKYLFVEISMFIYTFCNESQLYFCAGQYIRGTKSCLLWYPTVITLSWKYSSYGYLKYILTLGVKGENKRSEHF
jgi:hypothetical protein